jgi:DHA1 family tetracycline resistance protein-like MFS transporter
MKNQKTSQSQSIIFIFITLLIDVIGIGIIIPIVPGLVSSLTGLGMNEASRYGGWLMFSYALMQFIFSPVMGNLSDRFGRRPILLLSLTGLGLDYILHALAPSIWWLFIGRLIAGVFGASFTTANAYIADISTPEKRAQNFGLVGAAFGLGFIIGPFIGGIAGSWGPRVPFYIAAALSLLNVMYGYFILPESLSKNNRRSFAWSRANPLGSLIHLKKYPVVSGLIATLVLIYIAAHAVQSSWGYFTAYRFNWGEKEIGYSLAFVGLIVAIVQGGLIRLLIPKLGRKRAVYIGMSFYALGLFLFAFASKSWMMYAFCIPYSLGGIAGPAIQGIVSSQVPDNEQGELQGALTSLMSVTSIIGPLLMNNLFAYFTSKTAIIYFPGAAFFTAAILILTGTFLAWINLRKYNLAHE